MPASFNASSLAGDTLQEKLGFTEDAQNQGNKVGLPSKFSRNCKPGKSLRIYLLVMLCLSLACVTMDAR